jgi:serine/threonine-protein kinase
VPKGTSVQLTVSLGPPPVQVPNVVGMDATTAQSLLEQAGFQVELQNQLNVVVLNKVYSQDPAGGSMAQPGTTIILKIV